MPELCSTGKINLFLEVTKKRADGFHAIDSVFAEIDLRDTIRADATDDGAIVLGANDSSLPLDDGNLVVRAAALLRREARVTAGVRLFLEKHIPPGSGIGGGSANAAATLRLLDAVWCCRFRPERLEELGARLGSDVPFFFHGGLCRCQGRGEIITPLANPAAPLRLGLVLTGMHSDTAAAYRNLCLPAPGAARSAGAFLNALARTDVEGMEAAAFNRFEETVFTALPKLREIHEGVTGVAGRPVRMSGSGSALWFFRRDEKGDEPVAQWCVNHGLRYVAVETVMRETVTGMS